MLIDNPENPFSRDFLKVTGRKISSVTKLDGDFIEKSEETQTVTHRKNKPNVVHIKKLVRKMFGKNNVETETQSLYEYQKDAPKKGYTVESCFKTRLGLSLDLFSPTYNFENFPKELAKRFEKDPYFLLHLYSDKEFRKFAPACAKHPQHSLAIEPKINWTNRKKASGSYDHDGNIFLNRKKLNNKLKIINTAAHEKEHVFQEEQCIFSAIENGEPYYFLPISEERFKMYEEYVKDGGPYKIHSPKDTDSYWVNMQHYISSDVDLDGYKNQILERHANIAGAIAEEAYAKSSRDLKEEFLYAPDYLIGVTQRESLDRWAEQF